MNQVAGKSQKHNIFFFESNAETDDGERHRTGGTTRTE